MATNPAAILNDFCTKNNTKFQDEYTHTGPPNDRTFTCTITLQGESFGQKGTGHGKTKKESKLNASMDLLYQLDSRSEKNISLPVDMSPLGRGTSPSLSDPPTPTSLNAKGKLQEFCQKRSLSIPTYTLISREGPAHQLQFTVKCTVRRTGQGDTQLIGEGLGMATSLKGAEANAATNVYEFLTTENPTLEPIQETETPTSEDLIDLGTPPVSPQSNIKGKLQELCQQNSLLIPVYTVISKTGPTHSPNFTVKCQVKDMQEEVIEDEYGYGKSLKVAEFDAAAKTKVKIEKLLEAMDSSNLGGGASPQFISKSSRNALISKEIVDPVEYDELVAQLIVCNCMEPHYLYDTTQPVDSKDQSTTQHLCLAYTSVMHGYIARKCPAYDVSKMPIVGQGIGATEDEAKNEALLTLIHNVRALGVAN